MRPFYPSITGTKWAIQDGFKTGCPRVSILGHFTRLTVPVHRRPQSFWFFCCGRVISIDVNKTNSPLVVLCHVASSAKTRILGANIFDPRPANELTRESRTTPSQEGFKTGWSCGPNLGLFTRRTRPAVDSCPSNDLTLSRLLSFGRIDP